MSHGFKCKNCGRTEETHDDPKLDKDPSQHAKGYRTSLKDCPGFALNCKDQRSYNFICEEKAWEKRGRARAAWGQFQSVMGGINMERNLEKIDKEIRKAPSIKERVEAEERKKAYLDDCRRGNRRMIIG